MSYMSSKLLLKVLTLVHKFRLVFNNGIFLMQVTPYYRLFAFIKNKGFHPTLPLFCSFRKKATIFYIGKGVRCCKTLKTCNIKKSIFRFCKTSWARNQKSDFMPLTPKLQFIISEKRLCQKTFQAYQ